MFLPHILPAPDPSVMRAVPGTASKSNQSPPNPRASRLALRQVILNWLML